MFQMWPDGDKLLSSPYTCWLSVNNSITQWFEFVNILICITLLHLSNNRNDKNVCICDYLIITLNLKLQLYRHKRVSKMLLSIITHQKKKQCTEINASYSSYLQFPMIYCCNELWKWQKKSHHIIRPEQMKGQK